jgi:Ser/Thr protein kinase RdoA (MazF antagonist)
MKAYDELTRLGRIRRIRRLAAVALAKYGMGTARLCLLRQAGNTLFRVWTDYVPDTGISRDLFEQGQYLLRVHQPGYQETEAIELELAWLTAMRQEADLPVPEPVTTRDGRLLLPVSDDAVPGTRNCSLLRWIRGRSVGNRFQLSHFRAQGRLMAQLHNFSAQWPTPAGMRKRRFDWDGLFQNDVGSGMTNAEAWALLSPLNWQAFSFVAERVREVMNEWGRDRDVFGLIHGDLGVDANLLFWHGQPRAIDFDDSGFGYWVFDLAVALDVCRDDPHYSRYRDALLNGYSEFRSLPQRQADQIELFLAGSEVYWNLWATGGTRLHPNLQTEYGERMARTAQFTVRYARREGALLPNE